MKKNVVNNQHKRGYDHGYDDGVKGKRKKRRYPKGSSKYAIETYSKGYYEGHKQGSIFKKQNDNKARQGQRHSDSVKQSKLRGFLKLLFLTALTVVALLIIIFYLNL